MTANKISSQVGYYSIIILLISYKPMTKEDW